MQAVLDSGGIHNSITGTVIPMSLRKPVLTLNSTHHQIMMLVTLMILNNLKLMIHIKESQKMAISNLLAGLMLDFVALLQDTHLLLVSVSDHVVLP